MLTIKNKNFIIRTDDLEEYFNDNFLNNIVEIEKYLNSNNFKYLIAKLELKNYIKIFFNDDPELNTDIYFDEITNVLSFTVSCEVHVNDSKQKLILFEYSNTFTNSQIVQICDEHFYIQDNIINVFNSKFEIIML